jgi:hypothetical protein
MFRENLVSSEVVTTGVLSLNVVAPADREIGDGPARTEVEEPVYLVALHVQPSELLAVSEESVAPPRYVRAGLRVGGLDAEPAARVEGHAKAERGRGVGVDGAVEYGVGAFLQGSSEASAAEGRDLDGSGAVLGERGEGGGEKGRRQQETGESGRVHDSPRGRRPARCPLRGALVFIHEVTSNRGSTPKV